MANHYTRAVPEIDDGQREELERWLRRSKTGQERVISNSEMRLNAVRTEE